jgi:hypothetical protein
MLKIELEFVATANHIQKKVKFDDAVERLFEEGETVMSTVMEATELDGKGLDEVKDFDRCYPYPSISNSRFR